MRLHLLTAVTRPANLPTIAASLETANDYGIQAVWHKRFDPDHTSVGGQSLKNAMIAEIADGWIYILDDDTIIHPAFWKNVALAAFDPLIAMIVLTQQFTSGHTRLAHLGMLKSSHVDAGQVVVRRDAIGELRIPEHYCGDGDWIEALSGKLRGRIACVATPSCYYNALRTGQ